jgi:hypothetical protein
MPIPHSREMGTLGLTRPMYRNRHIGSNSIGAEGCSHLSKGKWTHLIYLNIGTTTAYLWNNSIEAEGCRHLSQAKWDNLSSIDLRTQLMYIRKHHDWSRGMQASQSGGVASPNLNRPTYNNDIFREQRHQSSGMQVHQSRIMEPFDQN